MVVPYGDPDRGWFVRNALDEGELGLGQFVQPLREGVDVPAGAQFLPAVIANDRGVPVVHPRAIAVYERDGGLAWRHLELARRSRELVIEWIASLGNYEYGFAWILHEDGTIEQRTTLTGIMSVKGTDAAPDTSHTSTPHGQRITRQLVAPHHQHFFAFRLDTDVDGAAHQQVAEVDGQADDTRMASDPHSAMTAAATVLPTELAAQRQTAGTAARRWTVQNTAVRNAAGGVVGVTLLPGENARPLADTTAWIRKRAGFLNAQLWVTPYRANELYAAGEYPNQSRGGEGLPAFTRGNANVRDTDVVLWYVMGITHLPRPEDWPVMPAHVAGFKLVPTGFFDANPLMKR
jgi:primary-amine oxidase